MSYEFIQVEKVDSVATIVLNNPAKHNALNEKMIAELTSAFEAKSFDSTVQMVVLKAAGRSFCAGADLEYMRSMAKFSKEENIRDAEKLSRLFETLLNCPLPIIGVAHGSVYGGGIGLFASCDILLADLNTKFCFSEVKLGLAPAVISPISMARIGFHQARRYFLTGEVFGAEEAKQMNLAHEIVTSETLTSKLDTLTQALMQGGTIAQGNIKMMINSLVGFYNFPQWDLPQLQQLIAKLRVSDEAQERMKSFLNK